MPNKVWMYGRRSKLESKKESETAMDKQYIKVLAHAVDNYRGYDIAMCSDESNFFWDENISGSTLFSERPAGSLVYHGASRGDVVIAVAMDRLFRNKADGFKTIEEFAGKGITYVVLDYPELGNMSEMGRDAIETFSIYGASMYSLVCKHKRNSYIDHCKNEFIPWSHTAAMGYKIVERNGKKSFAVDLDERKLIDHIVWLHAIQGWSFKRIAVWGWTQTEFPTKAYRRMKTDRQCRWAYRARMEGYETCKRLTNLEEFTKWYTEENMLV